jgi:chemotaxis protein MotB
MTINNLLIPAAVFACLTSGCVSTQKYTEMQKARDHYKAEFESTKSLERENAELTSQLRVLENQVAQLKGDLIKQVSETEQAKKEVTYLSSMLENASKVNEKILTDYSYDKTKLEDRVASQTDELNLRDRQLEGLEETIGVQSYSMESMKLDLASRERRVAELEKLIIEKEAQMEKLRNSLKEALTGFSNADLSVAERNGKIYVTLSQSLLFKTNSDQVDTKGVTALQQVAAALVANPAIEAVVEGHTDNSGSVDHNWDLSTRRATAVVKLLSINGVAPARLVAAGRGMHHPVAPNDSEANKAKNRRTEIILSPNLDKLLELSK